MAKKPVVTDVNDTEELPKGDDVTVDAVVTEAEVAPETDVSITEPKKKSSFSGKVLSALALLLAGGAAALYGGPKLAPMLPAGMAPVAQFLSPGEASTGDKLASLEEKLNTRLTAIENVEAPDVKAAFTDLSADMNSRITALSDQVTATDSGDIEARLTAVETQLSGLAASIETLSVPANADGSVDVSGFQATIDGLKAQIETLSSKQGMMGQKIDDVAANTNRRVEEAQTKVTQVEETAQATITDITRAKAISDIAGAMETGGDFSAALATLTDGGVSVPDALTSVAGGVTTLTTLKSDFSSAAHASLKASIKGETPDSMTGKLAGFFKSQVTVRSLEPQEGETTDAILSRIQGALDGEDLGAALQHAAGLNDASKSAMANWLSAAQTRQTALDAVSAFSKN
jgi:hypothetical protein